MKKLFCLLLLLTASNALAGSDSSNFEKLDGTGKSLPVDAIKWAMVKDKSTGLMWEVKHTNDSIHGMDARYEWTDATATFIAALNQKHFGGYSNWRMPTEDQIYTISKRKKIPPHTNS